MSFGDFSDVGGGVGVVDFVEGEDGGKAGAYEGGDHGGDGGRIPGFEGAAEVEGVEGLVDDGGGGAVAGKLGLHGVDWVGFCGNVAAFKRAPVEEVRWVIEVAGRTGERYHLSMRLPSIQLTISERSHIMSWDGS